jgi:hypothetical protein
LETEQRRSSFNQFGTLPYRGVQVITIPFGYRSQTMDSCNWTPSIVIDDEDSILAAIKTISTSTNSLERAEFLLILASNLIAKETTYESACTDEELMDALRFTHLAFESTPDTPEHQPVHDHIAQLYSQCLSLSCERAANLDQLEMAIVLSREVYNRHSTHTCELRRVSGNNLSHQIAQHITLTGDTQFIMTLVTMCRRELDFALEQEGENSLERAMALTNMGIALQKCYDLTSDAKLIRQACDAHQLALEVCPQDHSARFIILSSFAASLIVLYKLRPDPAMLKMIYHLHEEVLRSQPPGHPFRAITLGNFSGVLKMLFDKTRERHYIDQAIDLQEERLALRPPGHQQRKVACYNLMTSYTAVLVHWPDSSGDAYKRALDLANTIFEEELSSDHYNFLTLVALCDIHTIASPYQDIALGLVNLEQACQLLESSTLPSYAAYQPLLRCLERVSNRTLTFKSKEVQGQMLSMFSRVADSLPLLAGFALDKEDRLDLLRMTEWLGPASFACSLKAEELVRGLEILELVRGTFWSQAVHLQDPRLEDVPQHLSEELGELMQKLATMRSDENDSDSETSTDQQELRIRRHYLATKASEVILEVRLTPGLERFMLGLPFAQLKQVASAHPVVVLVDSSAGMHAVILRSADTTPECLELPGAEMISLDHVGLSSTRGEDNTMLGEDEVDKDDEVDVACEGDKGDVADQVSQSMRAMTLSYPSRRQSGGKIAKVLAQTWLEVVKPILTHLGLEVRHLNLGLISRNNAENDILLVETNRPGAVSDTLVPYRQL